jgi:ABC-type branched-subunit amino acid transport system substrate-binding protein
MTSLSRFGLWLALASPGLAAASVPVPPAVEDALAFVESDRARAASLLEAAAEDASPRDLPTILLHAGEQRRLLGELDRAREWFTTVRNTGARHGNPVAAALGLALIDAAGGATAETIDVLRTTPDADALPSMNADRHLVLAIVAAASGDAASLEAHRSRARAALVDAPDVAERVTARLDGLTLSSSGSSDGPIVLESSDLPDLELAERALARGDRARVLELVAAIRADNPTPEEVRQADALVERLDAAPVQADKVCLLLPLSGRYLSVGTQVKEAFEYGFRRAGLGGRVDFVDAGADATSAVAGLKELALRRGCMAVVGPLLTDQGAAVAEAAQALHVPLLSLSQAYEPTGDDDYVFRVAVSVADQTEALASYAISTRNLRDFAVFAPDNDYGRGATEAFRASVEERGGTVRSVQFYSTDATYLVPFATQLKRKGPIDYDGIFIPDSARRVALAASALAYEEFPVGAFQVERDGPTIPLLGLNGWNSPDLPTQGGTYVRNSIFTELFLPDGPAGAAFAASYRQTTGRAPTPLEAVVSDAGALVAAALSGRARDRDGFVGALRSAAIDDAVTGTDRLDPERPVARHRVRLMTVTRDDIATLDR